MQSQPASTPALPADTKVQGAATVSEVDTKTTKSSKELDMRYYNELMNNVPQESTSIALVMHSMLEQVDSSQWDVIHHPTCLSYNRFL